MLNQFDRFIRVLADIEPFYPQDTLSGFVRTEQELDETELDWVAAAGTPNAYQQFLERYKHPDKFD